jgi:hypothetical protein
MFEVYDGTHLADYCDRSLADDARIDDGMDEFSDDDDEQDLNDTRSNPWDYTPIKSPTNVRRSPRLHSASPAASPAAARSLAARSPAARPAAARLATAQPAAARLATAHPATARPAAARRMSAGPIKGNTHKKTKKTRTSDSSERADAAFERIATAKEEVAKSAKFAALLTHQGQLKPRQQRALSAITDAYLGELSGTSPITIDSLDDSPARPQHKLLPDTPADSESEEGF